MNVSKHIEVKSYFAAGMADPFQAIEWEERTARITGANGDILFEQEKVRVPKDWSVLATNIVASKYFWGKTGSKERESGVDALIGRVVKTITASGIEQGYFDRKTAEIFANELAYLLLHQYVAFNSPVFFNVGCDQYEPNAKAS